MALPEDIRQQITGLIGQSDVVLFMKGDRGRPACGFSAQVIQILDELGPTYATVDVLSDPRLRDGIKEFSEWPTIPQLYVKGKFVGGCDIVKEMHAGGELAALLGVKVEPVKAPSITLTAPAAEAFREALADAGDDVLRFEVSARYDYQLYFGPRAKGDLEVQAGGLALFLDPASARRADGTRIDYVQGPSGGGFKIDNPAEPPKVKQIGPAELQKMMVGATPPHLFDVRGDKERAIAKIDAAMALDEEAKKLLEGLDRSATLVFHCHHGGRSQTAAEHFLSRGFRDVYNLRGGIDAWSREVDPKVPRY